MISDNKKALMREVINCFENDSGSPKTDFSTIYLYHDGPNKMRQVTLGFGITEFGNMKALLVDYVDAKGKFAEDFRPYLTKIGNTRSPLAGDKAFIALLVKASLQDQIFRDQEDRIFEQKYWDPAFKFFTDNGFTQNLSMMVILDSYIHSGSILSFLRSRFPESVPARGGNEKTWIKQYVDARQSWLANNSNAILRGTIYRTKCFKLEIAEDNWVFDPPIIANGVKLSS